MIKYKRIICCLLTVMILFGCISGLNQLLCNKQSKAQFSMFYNAETNFDVLFFGSSHMLNALNPMVLWEEQGIASYNMAFGSCRISYCYWLARNAFLRCQPSLVVIDCAYIYRDEKAAVASYPNHCLFDEMPLNEEKLRAIFDLYDTRQERFKYLFPLSEFHRRWNDLQENDFFTELNIMGYSPVYVTEEATLLSGERDDSVYVNTQSSRYLRHLIEECKARDIDVLLTFIPFQANEESQKDMAYIYRLADEYGVNYIDADTIAAFLNTKSDFINSYDDNSHLNQAGAQKFSSFIADYIVNEYDIVDRRNDSSYDSWQNFYSAYLEKLDQGIEEVQNPAEMMSLLYTGEHSSFIQILSDEVLEEKIVTDCMENVGLNIAELSSCGCALICPDGILYGDDAVNSPLYSAYSEEISAIKDGSVLFAMMREEKLLGIRVF